LPKAKNRAVEHYVGYADFCIPFAEFGGMRSIPYRTAQLFNCSKRDFRMPFMFENLEVYQKSVDLAEKIAWTKKGKVKI
jgi:hypothetical protein